MLKSPSLRCFGYIRLSYLRQWVHTLHHPSISLGGQRHVHNVRQSDGASIWPGADWAWLKGRLSASSTAWEKEQDEEIEDVLWSAETTQLLLCSRSVVPNPLQLQGLQHTRLPCPSLSPRVCLNSHPLSWWCYATISSSVAPFSFCSQSFPAETIAIKYWPFKIIMTYYFH